MTNHLVDYMFVKPSLSSQEKKIILYSLQKQFLSVWRRQAVLFNKQAALVIFNALVEKYSESQRAYHGLSHISNSLKYFEACRNEAVDPDAIEIAIWFHDCIYEIGAADNEQKSVDWFLDQTQDQLSSELRDKIAELIMDTTHKNVPATSDGRLLADVDMSSFGRPWNEYIRDSKAVCDEFPEQDTAQKDRKLVGFLQYLLGKGPIYHSPFYARHYEQKAQENISKHIRLLT